MNETKELTRNLSKRANELLYFSYKLSPITQDIIQVILSQITDEDTSLNRYTISVLELEKKIGKQIKNSMFDNIIKELFQPSFQLKNEEGRTVDYGWCAEFTRPCGDRTITVEIHKILNSYLLKLKERKIPFTIIDTKYFVKLKSSYSKRLYPIFRNKMDIARLQKKSAAYYNEDKSKFLKILGTPKSFERYVNLKNRVLLVAVKEISEFTDLDIKLVEEKRGNKVIDFGFIIKEKKEIQIEKLKKELIKKTKSANSTNYGANKSGVDAVGAWLEDANIIETEVIA